MIRIETLLKYVLLSNCTSIFWNRPCFRIRICNSELQLRDSTILSKTQRNFIKSRIPWWFILENQMLCYPFNNIFFNGQKNNEIKPGSGFGSGIFSPSGTRFGYRYVMWINGSARNIYGSGTLIVFWALEERQCLQQ